MSEWEECCLDDPMENKPADLQTGPFGTMVNASEYTSNGIPVIAMKIGVRSQT